MSILVVNDSRSTIPGTSTLWDYLCEWFGGEFVGAAYQDLKRVAEKRAESADVACIIRNSAYFPPLDVKQKQIAIVQDILTGAARELQVEVCRKSSLVVFNSNYTRKQYPELDGHASQVIPLPVDFDLFRHHPPGDVELHRQRWSIKPGSVCWVGANFYVKGFDILWRVIEEMPDTNFVIIRKDIDFAPAIPNGRVRCFGRLSHKELVQVYNCCAAGLVTSRQETQHLAGIEMAGCGLPVVAPPVGIYADEAREWAWRCDDTAMLSTVLAGVLEGRDELTDIRERVMAQEFTMDKCMEAWRALVA